MFKNYLKIAWRTLLRDKTHAAINLLGLSIAFAVTLLLAMAAFFELSYDDFQEKGQYIYQAYTVQQTPEGPQASTSQPSPFAKSLQDEVPGIQGITRYLEDNALAIRGEKELDMDVAWIDADFFSMFTLPVLKGNPESILENLNSVALSTKAAVKLFGTSDVIGEVFEVLINGRERPFIVGAIVEDFPLNSSLQFEMALRFENNPEYAGTKDSWNAQYHDVFLQLENTISPYGFESNTKPFVDLHYEEVMANAKRDGALANKEGAFMAIKLLPLKDVHFTSFRKGYAEVSRSSPYLILAIAALILFIANVNLINMSVAKSAQRLKEIGMRKTLGARRKQLFLQFWGESLFIFIGAFALGMVLAYLGENEFKTIFRTDVSLELLLTPSFVFAFLTLVLAISIVAGGYPALVLSRMGTIQSLQGKLEARGNQRIRDILIVVQFGMAILLITGTLVLRSQIGFMRNKDLGYDKEQVISFPLNGKKDSYAALDLLKQELSGNPDILGVSGADNNLGRGRDGNRYGNAIGFEYQGRVVMSNFLVVDHDYLETLGLEMVMGRSFEKPSDSIGVLINEAMVRELQEEAPLTALLDISDSIPSPVLGVVKDYHFQDLDRSIQPLTFYMGRDLALTYAYVKVAPTQMANSYEAVESAWRKIEPNAEFLGSFLDENIDRTFRREKITATLVTSGSVIAILLSCIGLFAMSMLVVTQRTKEIGIRKVIGASVSSITYILAKDFMKLVLFGFLLALPIAWWILNEWLKNYAYRIELSPWFFGTAGILAMVIAFMTIGFKTISAARANPVKSLRSE